ncbi:putative transposase [Rubripirellula obstinata]|uniref:Putative transposase n=1 Tax=Rubripirellula obstinata TaxID=406547 RepID=A0A5B1C8M8_9BACT|nr:putative transposase [Rubripirellula obstinata]
MSSLQAKFADHLRELGLYDQVDASVWKKKWIVDIRAVGDGRSVLKYLAPYVHRVAISDNRIVSVDEKTVTFRYTPSKSRQSKTRSVSGHQFVGGFAQHVLPSRLQKIRYYGWMSPNSGISPEEVRWLLAIALGLGVHADVGESGASSTQEISVQGVRRRNSERFS